MIEKFKNKYIQVEFFCGIPSSVPIRYPSKEVSDHYIV